MVSKKLTLTIPDSLWKKLEKEKKDYSYTSVQQVIRAIIRWKFYAEEKKETRGRPKKFDEMKFLSRKKIFSKDGVKIPI